MALSSLYLANSLDIPSYLILVADSDFYFSDNTKVALADADPSKPTMTVLKVKALGDKKRKLLIRYKVDKAKAARPMAGAGDVETGAVTVTLTNPSDKAVVAVAYVDDDGAA